MIKNKTATFCYNVEDGGFVLLFFLQNIIQPKYLCSGFGQFVQELRRL